MFSVEQSRLIKNISTAAVAPPDFAVGGSRRGFAKRFFLARAKSAILPTKNPLKVRFQCSQAASALRAILCRVYGKHLHCNATGIDIQHPATTEPSIQGTFASHPLDLASALLSMISFSRIFSHMKLLWKSTSADDTTSLPAWSYHLREFKQQSLSYSSSMRCKMQDAAP